MKEENALPVFPESGLPRNQIYCMDYLELSRRLPDGSVSMILTDPPYGIG